MKGCCSVISYKYELLRWVAACCSVLFIYSRLCSRSQRGRCLKQLYLRAENEVGYRVVDGGYFLTSIVNFQSRLTVNLIGQKKIIDN